MDDTARFVTFPLGTECYALDSGQVKELVMPSRVYTFPHTARALEGVLVRNGKVIPVCDLRPGFWSWREAQPLHDRAMQLRRTRRNRGHSGQRRLRAGTGRAQRCAGQG